MLIDELCTLKIQLKDDTDELADLENQLTKSTDTTSGLKQRVNNLIMLAGADKQRRNRDEYQLRAAAKQLLADLKARHNAHKAYLTQSAICELLSLVKEQNMNTNAYMDRLRAENAVLVIELKMFEEEDFAAEQRLATACVIDDEHEHEHEHTLYSLRLERGDDDRQLQISSASCTEVDASSPPSSSYYSQSSEYYYAANKADDHNDVNANYGYQKTSSYTRSTDDYCDDLLETSSKQTELYDSRFMKNTLKTPMETPDPSSELFLKNTDIF